MNDTACFLYTREISLALKTFSLLQRIRTRPTIFLTDKKEKVAVKELPPSPLPAARCGEFHLGCVGTSTWRLQKHRVFTFLIAPPQS